jgi:HEAT repeat protein
VDAAPASGAPAQALEALKTYDRGSGRAALLPLDQAVAAASMNASPARQQLEQQLAAILQAGGSAVAREYLCSKLALIGSARSAAALGALLDDALLATAARNALEALPTTAAAQALRERLPHLQSLEKVGAVNSLGRLGDAASTGPLTELLKNAEGEVAVAAAAALGGIGSVQAGEALRDFYAKAPESLRLGTADALLNCAERLLGANQRGEAQALYQALARATPPAPVHDAAQRGLRACAGKG